MNRSISWLTATCLVVANMIGTGVFVSLGYQVEAVPSPFAVVMLWVVGGIAAMCGALCYAGLSQSLPRSGGEYHFLSQIYHPSVGFLAGWLSATVGFAAPTALAAMTCGFYGSGALGGVPPMWIAFLVVAAVTTVHLLGIEVGGRFQVMATSLKVGLIVILIVAGCFAPHVAGVSFAPDQTGWGLMMSPPFAVSLVYVMYSYSGWNAAVYVLGEVRDPWRNLPVALVLGTALVAILYVLLNAMFLAVAPMADLKGQPEVGVVAAKAIFGAEGGRWMSGLIAFGLISAVSAMVWVGPRVSMTMGEDCAALRWLAWRSPRRNVPVPAMLAQTTITVLLMATVSFEAVLTYVQFSLNLMTFLGVLGVYVLRFRGWPCRVAGYPFTPAIYLGVAGWMLAHLLVSNWQEALAGLGTLACGWILYVLSPARPASMIASHRP
jgi:APA family basic amino acid/polyamine antiporter